VWHVFHLQVICPRIYDSHAVGVNNEDLLWEDVVERMSLVEADGATCRGSRRRRTARRVADHDGCGCAIVWIVPTGVVPLSAIQLAASAAASSISPTVESVSAAPSSASLFRWRRRIWRRPRCCSTGERSSALTAARSLMMACFAHTTTPQESHRHVAGQRALSNGCWSSVETKSVLS